ncbi:MAG: sugar transferase [Saprospiraceae bacterium]|nr:sugar transferase [Pyrinomonadaceae bacterium]
MKAETAIKNSIGSKRLPEPNRAPRWVMPFVKAAVFAVDGVLAAASFLLAFKLREGDAVLSTTAWAWSKEFVPYAGILYFAVLIRLVILSYQRVYRYHGAFSYTQEATKIFKAVAVSSLLTVAWAFLFRGGFAFREFSYSRGVFVFDFVIAFAIFTVFHLGLRFAQAQFRKREINLIPTLIVGTNAEAKQTIRELTERRELGYRVTGVVAAEFADGRSTRSDFEQDFPGFDVVGNMDDLPVLIRELAIQEVIITDNTLPSEKLFDAMMSVGRKQKVEFRFAPSLFNLLPQKTSVEQIGVLPMVRLFREPLSEAERFVKRLSDIVISAIAIILLSPFWLIVSLIIKLDSRGSILFRQERVGMDGRIFLCYKFRSMGADSDDELHRQAYRHNIEGLAEANAGDGDKPVFGKVKDDPRITNAGKYLRRSSFDELPQILNVLKGDMSIVGPRPPIPYEVEEYDMWHRKRLDMKPGITGLWQVSGRSRLTFDEMVRIDLFYIENWSLWLDLKIIFLTLPAIFRGDEAR